MIKVLIAADVVMAAAFAWAFRSLPEQVPIFYSKPWGEAQIADAWYLLLLPILLHLIYFLNHGFAKRFFKNEETIINLVNYANLFFIIGFTGVYLKILLLVS